MQSKTRSPPSVLFLHQSLLSSYIVSHPSSRLPHIQPSLPLPDWATMGTSVVELSLGHRPSRLQSRSWRVEVGDRKRGLEMNRGDRAQHDNKSLLPSVSVSECQCV